MIVTKYKDKDNNTIFIGDKVLIENGDYPVETICKNVDGYITLEDSAFGQWTRQLYHQPERLTKL